MITFLSPKSRDIARLTGKIGKKYFSGAFLNRPLQNVKDWRWIIKGSRRWRFYSSYYSIQVSFTRRGSVMNIALVHLLSLLV